MFRIGGVFQCLKYKNYKPSLSKVNASFMKHNYILKAKYDICLSMYVSEDA